MTRRARPTLHDLSTASGVIAAVKAQESELLKDVKVNPELRGVLADFLEDNGEPEKAPLWRSERPDDWMQLCPWFRRGHVITFDTDGDVETEAEGWAKDFGVHVIYGEAGEWLALGCDKRALEAVYVKTYSEVWGAYAHLIPRKVKEWLMRDERRNYVWEVERRGRDYQTITFDYAKEAVKLTYQFITYDNADALLTAYNRALAETGVKERGRDG